MIESPADAPWRRLHPATMLVEVVQRAISLAWFLVIVALLLIMGERTRPTEFVLVAIAASQVLWPIVVYLTLRYRIAGDSLLVRQGVLFRQARTIRLERIQNINFQRGLLHRMFGVVRLSVETAVSGRAEAELAVISEAEAERLRGELLRHRGGTAPDTPEPVGEVLWTASARDLFILGATENRVAWIIGIFGVIFQQTQEFVWPRLQQFVEMYLPRFDRFDRTSVALWIIGGAVSLVIVGSLVSIVMSFITHHGFTLRRDNGRLRRKFGLITQHETVLPIQRVQVAQVHQPWLRRMLGYATIYVETAGAVTRDEQAGATPLCPLLHRTQIDRFLRLVFADLSIDEVPWQRVSRYTIRRGFIRYTRNQLIIVAAAGYWLGWGVLYALPIVVAISILAARARYRALGYAEVGRFVLVRAGVFTHRIWIIPRSKIQSVAVVQSLFQRRYGLADLTPSTAGASHLRPATIFDIEHDCARAMQDRLSLAANRAGEWAVDGV